MIVCPVLPRAVQTDAGDAVNFTTRPEEAVALAVYGDWAIVMGPGLPNAIVWDAVVIAKVWVTGSAAL